MHKSLIFSFLMLQTSLAGQVFQRPFESVGSLALGSATVAFPNLEAGLTNEALLGLPLKTQAWCGAMVPFGLTDWRAAQLQIAQGLGRGSGLALDFAQSGLDIYREQRLRLAYGRRLGERFLLGAAFDFLRLQADEYGAASALNFGLSLLAEPLPNLRVGARIFNPLSLKINDLAVPGRIRFGLSWASSKTLVALAELEKDVSRPAVVKFGLEYRLRPAVALRLGARTGPGRFSFGATLRAWRGLSLDFASEWHPILGITPAAGIVWRRE